MCVVINFLKDNQNRVQSHCIHTSPMLCSCKASSRRSSSLTRGLIWSCTSTTNCCQDMSWFGPVTLRHEGRVDNNFSASWVIGLQLWEREADNTGFTRETAEPSCVFYSTFFRLKKWSFDCLQVWCSALSLSERQIRWRWLQVCVGGKEKKWCRRRGERVSLQRLCRICASDGVCL